LAYVSKACEAAMSRFVRPFIVLVGVLCICFGASLASAILNIAHQDGPLGYAFATQLGLPLLFLGWRIAARRYWAGVVLVALLGYGVCNFPLDSSPVIRIEEAWTLSIFVFLVLAITVWRDQWINKP